MFRSPELVLRAKSIAIVGASERAPWARLIYRNLRDFGYPGRLILVNPRQKEVFGEPCVPSLRDAPEPVDHAMIIVPAGPGGGRARRRGCRGHQVRHGLCRGDGRRQRSGNPNKCGAWLKDFLTRSKMRVAGPNCMGAHSYHEKLFAYPNTELGRFPAGSVGCIFQSGGTLQFWLRSGADRGLRFSYGITSGNEADLDLADYLDLPGRRSRHSSDRPVHRGHPPAAGVHAGGRTRARSQPVLAIKTGATAKSRSAAQSHTGAIGGDYAAYLAMCERYGIVNCRSLDDMLEVALAFDGRRLPKRAAHRLRHHLRRHRRPALRLRRGGRLADAGLCAGDAPRPDAVHAGRHRAQEPARSRHSDGDEARRQRLRGRRPRSQHRHDRLGRHAAEQGRRLGGRRGAYRRWSTAPTSRSSASAA